MTRTMTARITRTASRRQTKTARLTRIRLKTVLMAVLSASAASVAVAQVNCVTVTTFNDEAAMGETFEYDLNANILNLERRYGGDAVQDAARSYNGNRVASVNDASLPYYADIVPSFAAGTYAMEYDEGGRLTADDTRQITRITYTDNGAQMPQSIDFANGSRIINTYLPDGTLLQRDLRTIRTRTIVRVNAQGDTIVRMHDALLCRFTTRDPLAAKHPEHSPYLFCGANPITYVDPTGMEVFYNLKGKVIYETEENKDTIYIVLTSEKKGSDQANTAINNKEYISLPNSDLMKKIEKIKSDTEKIGKEHGFAVSESGTIGSITQGTKNSVEIESVVVNDDGTLEKAAFNVHTHPLRNSNDPTSNDGASEEDIMSYSGTKPSIVLGYDAEPLYINRNTSFPSGYSHTPFLIFYNQNGQIGEKANYKNFKKVVEKLWKK